jgi:hypothetical protein
VPYDGYNIMKAPTYVQAVQKDFATVKTDHGTYALVTGRRPRLRPLLQRPDQAADAGRAARRRVQLEPRCW